MSIQPLPLQLDFPTFRKSIKITVNPRHSIKQILIVFSQKLEIDYSSYTIVAKVKIDREKKVKIPTDIPLMYAV